MWIYRAIGIGAVQANMAVFGAEQIPDFKYAARYFDKYFLAVNIGATIATLSIPLIQNDSADQTTAINYFYGYLTAIFMLIAAVVLFMLGYRYYIHIPPGDSIVLKYIPVIINACQTRRRYGRNRADTQINGISLNEERRFSFLDYANDNNQGKFDDRIINDAKAFQRAVVVFLFLIPYWIIYYQV